MLTLKELVKSTPLHNYQKRAVKFVVAKRRVALFMDMGLGKTLTTLIALLHIQQKHKAMPALVIAPLSVAKNVWPSEIKKWKLPLTVSLVMGSAAQRKKALEAKAHVFVINRENVPWLSRQLDIGQFRTLIVDESSSFKSHASKRFRALAKTAHKHNNVILLSGTPAPNSMIDLWSQLYLLDGGERLGRRIGQYREKYFVCRYGQSTWKIRNKLASLKIKSAIKDICVHLSAKDHLKQLPNMIQITRPVRIPARAVAMANKIKEEGVIDLMRGAEVAPSISKITQSILQVASGAVYAEDKSYEVIHDAKLDALEEIVEEAQGESLLVVYNFVSERERLVERFPDAVVWSGGGSADVVDQWNSGRIKMLVAHPASIGHGVNLQQGGSVVVWLGPTWNLEYYLQTIARLHRQGQTKVVRVISLISQIELEKRVVRALNRKEAVQQAVLDYLKVR